MNMRILVLSVIALAPVTSSAAPGDPPPAPASAPAAPAPAPPSPQGTGLPGSGSPGTAPTDSSSDEFLVIGEVLKPEITVVISRENLNKAYELKLDESFLDKIIASVEQAPF